MLPCLLSTLVLLAPAPRLAGPYLGQKAPGLTPEPFARDYFPRGLKLHGSPSFSADGREFYLSAFPGPQGERILRAAEVDGVWSDLAEASFQRAPHCGDPCLAPGGHRLYFSAGPGGADRDLWVVERTGSTWGEARPLAFNTPALDQHASVARGGTLYFRRGNAAFRADWKQGALQPPVDLGPAINRRGDVISPCVSPDERLLVVCRGLPDRNVLSVSFRRPDGAWGELTDLGPAFNAAGEGQLGARFPRFSPDGRHFFFTRIQRLEGRLMDIPYWVDARALETLRPR